MQFLQRLEKKQFNPQLTPVLSTNKIDADQSIKNLSIKAQNRENFTSVSKKINEENQKNQTNSNSTALSSQTPSNQKNNQESSDIRYYVQVNSFEKKQMAIEQTGAQIRRKSTKDIASTEVGTQDDNKLKSGDLSQIISDNDEEILCTNNSFDEQPVFRTMELRQKKPKSQMNNDENFSQNIEIQDNSKLIKDLVQARGKSRDSKSGSLTLGNMRKVLEKKYFSQRIQMPGCSDYIQDEKKTNLSAQKTALVVYPNLKETQKQAPVQNDQKNLGYLSQSLVTSQKSRQDKYNQCILQPDGKQINLIYKTRDSQIYPGVCHYDTADLMLKLKSTSPAATMGKAPRFAPEKLREYVETTPHSYSKQTAFKPKQGTFTKHARNLTTLDLTKFCSPGVGDYDLTKFKCLTRASETFFGLQNSYQQEQKVRKQVHRRRLGGPMVPLENYMMQASRQRRLRVYDNEIQQQDATDSLVGPTSYKNDKPSSQPKYSIGRTQRILMR